jgi:ribosomal protein L37AE/L43A
MLYDKIVNRDNDSTRQFKCQKCEKEVITLYFNKVIRKWICEKCNNKEDESDLPNLG